MSRFKEIDPKLMKLSQKLEAKLTIDRDWDPTAGFEERRIDWIDNDIFKAIIIQPTFKSKGVDSSKWNFINIAWHDDAKSVHRPKWMNNLVNEGKFEIIESKIDDLLLESENALSNISMSDLK
ncbi:hypothetical protein [Kordia sp.]|uniref:hypothetical protein n=1 Tax=Kordia sp. TaxID=1965332 RepID=UPI0025B805F4|nr:hypothetical protein [Kordia sp.]MCH2195297.1 hypothetical protein [Kordia sp.]